MIKIAKFGGAVLKDHHGFLQMAKLMRKYSGDKIVIIVSALAKTTRSISNAASYAESGNLNMASELIDNVFSEHLSYAEVLIKQSDNKIFILNEFRIAKEKLNSLMKGISITGELTPRTKDMALSCGEWLSLNLVTCFLREQTFNCGSADATKYIISNDSFGKAEPIKEATKAKVAEYLMPIIENNDIIVTQGFVASTPAGDITTMGIESSNLTAALLAGILNSGTLTIWTDVEGVRTADPVLSIFSEPIKTMNFKEAEKAALNGVKLIYPDMIDILREYNLKLIFRSAHNPEGECTEITENAPDLNRTILAVTQPFAVYSFPNIMTKELTKINLRSLSATMCFCPEKAMLIAKINGHPLPPFMEPEREDIGRITFINISSSKFFALVQRFEEVSRRADFLHVSFDSISRTGRIFADNSIFDELQKLACSVPFMV